MEQPSNGRSGNKTRSYLLYAIGEIVLVMVGILLALQVNNWNEAKKIEASIQNALIEVREDLVQDTLALHAAVESKSIEYLAQLRVIEAIENKSLSSKDDKDLGNVMLMDQTVLTKNGYSLLNELGLSNLPNRELRNLLVQYYERDFSSLEKEFIDDKFEFEYTWLPYARLHFREWVFSEYAIPHSYEQLIEDPYFLSSLKFNIPNKESTLERHIEALKNASELIKLLDN